MQVDRCRMANSLHRVEFVEDHTHAHLVLHQLQLQHLQRHFVILIEKLYKETKLIPS